MAKKRIFISFDYDHDEVIKVFLASQAKLSDSPFDFIDASVKEHLTGDWKEKVKRRLQNCDQAIILCGQHTHTASGVASELSIIQELRMPYFLLKGYSDKICSKPNGAFYNTLYDWTWPNLKALIGGAR